jgi:7,8-dihydro-6-hydroxymethylpterin-pyrophosphokinase
MVPTSNPERKLNKKIRLSEAKGQQEKVAQYQKELDELLKRQTINKKNKELKEQQEQKKETMKSLTDNDFMNMCLQENKQQFKEKQFKEKNKKEEKKRSLEKAKRYATIMKNKQLEEDKEQETKGQLDVDIALYKKRESNTNQCIVKHEDMLKGDSESVKKMYDTIMFNENNNKKKTKKKMNKIFKQQSLMIELAIQGYKEEKKVSYEEAFKHIHSEIRNSADTKDKPKPKRTLDSKAKL